MILTLNIRASGVLVGVVSALLWTGIGPSATAQAPGLVATELLGRPTDHSVTVNVVPGEAVEAYFEYGTEPGLYTGQSTVVTAAAGEPIEVILEPLSADTRYYYRMRYRRPGDVNFYAGGEHAFHTQKVRRGTFVFTVQADSHLTTAPQLCDPVLYARTLANARADAPDFHIDLGDTFLAEKLSAPDAAQVAQLYLDHRALFGQLCDTAPLFLAIGNHDAELGWLLDGSPDNLAVWATQARQRYYLNPVPDGFYTGDSTPADLVGLRGDYYAWEWGNALFVVLDPYWYTTTDPKVSGDNWDWTLGDAQYHWLEQTLAASRATFKFVFTHHVLGVCRGGIEWADFFEWGGKNRNGSWGFDVRRPGWSLPVHQLMAANGVTILVQGHDHLFAKQDLDGVVYQECPMPADSTYTAYNADAYLSGDTMPNSGHLRFTVARSWVRVDYVRSYLPADETPEHRNGETAYSYTIHKDVLLRVTKAPGDQIRLPWTALRAESDVRRDTDPQAVFDSTPIITTPLTEYNEPMPNEEKVYYDVD